MGLFSGRAASAPQAVAPADAFDEGPTPWLFDDERNSAKFQQRYQDRLRLIAGAFPARAGKEHLLALGTVSAFDQPSRSLEPLDPVEEPRFCRQFLDDAWEVTDHDSALATLGRSAQSGHAVDYAQEFAAEMARAPHEPTRLNACRRAMVASGVFSEADVMNCRSMAAWDIERILGAARRAHIAGYLSEDETYQYLEWGFSFARQEFRSWREYATSYNLARAVSWTSGPPNLMLPSLYFRLTDPRGLWAQYPLG